MKVLPTISTWLRYHRRLVAAVLAGIAVMAAVSAVSSSRTEPVTEVLIATVDVASGDVISPEAVSVQRFPTRWVPAGALTASDQAVGKLVAGGLRAGQVVTDTAVVADDQRGDRYLVGVRVGDPELASLATPGRRITVFSPLSAEPILSHVLVVATPAAASEYGTQTSGRLILVEVTAAQAAALAAATATGSITVVLG